MKYHTILLTGSTGFIGRDTTRYLLDRGLTIHATIRPHHPHPPAPHKNLHLFTADLLDPPSLLKAARGCQAVVHLAANKYHPTESFRVNVEGARNLISVCNQLKITRVINISSQSTNIQHKGPYALSKHLADQEFLRHSTSHPPKPDSSPRNQSASSWFWARLVGAGLAKSGETWEGRGQNRLGPPKSSQIFQSGGHQTRLLVPTTNYEQKSHAPLHLTILKPSLVYGPGENTLFGTITKFARLLPIIPIFGDGKWESYPIYVRDLSHAIYTCLTDDRTIGRTLDIGSLRPITMDNLIRSILHYHQLPSKPILHIPTLLGLAAGHLLSHPYFWRAGRTPPVTRDNILGSTQPTHCRPQIAAKLLHLTPLPLNQGIPLTLNPPPPDTRVRVAIVGLGKTGLMHASVLRSFPDVHITALIDTPQKRSTTQSLGFTAPYYTSLTDALKTGSFDTIFICTPTHLHFAQIRQAIRHSLHIFVEKTSVRNSQELHQLKSLISRYPRTTGAGYFYQFRPTYHLAQIILNRNLLGPIRHFEGTVHHSEVLGPKKGWIFNPALSGGGVLINPSPHFFSLLHHYFGSPTHVSSHLNSIYSRDIEDEAFVTFRYPHFQGTLYASWSTPNTPILDTTLSVTCDRGTLTVTPHHITVTNPTLAKSVAHLLPQTGYSWHTTKNTNALIYTPTFPDQPILNLSPDSGGEGYYLQDRHFIDCVISRRKFPNSLPTALAIESTIFRSLGNHV